VHEGVPKGASHIVLHKICSYSPTNKVSGAVILVGVVSFLDREGSVVKEWTNLPYDLNDLRTIVETKFSADGKCIFVPDNAYRLLSDPKLREGVTNDVVGEEFSSSDDDDDVFISQLAVKSHQHFTRSSRAT
jgi:hypothetical protein